MSQLPTNRTSSSTITEHVDDHNELHRLHNLLDDSRLHIHADPSGSSGASGNGRTNQSNGIALNRCVYLPLAVSVGHGYTTVGCRVAVASTGGTGVLRFGLYAVGSGGKPASRIVDGGTVSSTTTGFKSVAISHTATEPFVFVAVCPQSDVTSLQVGIIGNNGTPSWPGALYETSNGELTGLGYYETGVSGALPATATPVNFGSGDWGQNVAVYAY